MHGLYEIPQVSMKEKIRIVQTKSRLKETRTASLFSIKFEYNQNLIKIKYLSNYSIFFVILEFKKETHWKFEILRATIRSSFEYFQSSSSFYKSQPPIKKIYLDPRLMKLGHESTFESSSNLASSPQAIDIIIYTHSRLILYWYDLGTSWRTE